MNNYVVRLLIGDELISVQAQNVDEAARIACEKFKERNPDAVIYETEIED